MRREMGLDPVRGLIAALAVHVALYFLGGAIERPEPEPREIIEVEVIELPPEPKPEKPPEPEAPPEPEKPPEPEQPPEPEVKPKKPPPSKKIDAPKQPAPAPEPAPAAKPKRFELPASATVPAGSGSDVAVNNGTNTGSGSNSGGGTGTGTGTGTNTGTGPGGGNGTGTKPGVPWAPKNDLYIAQQPRPLRIPELECPAVTDRQIEGTVVLMVQVQRDGKVRSARVTQKLGYGCDDIAKKALRTAKFAPAMGTDGKTADYELRYEYAFELKD
ncbi:MAG: TonB family protein [Deltaproteobacteria bacterium]|nr:TonB family protein [Nannocystaceae bacterium]